MTLEPRPFTPMLGATWLTTACCIVLLWTLARYYTPRPEEFAAVLGLCLFGSACIFCSGLRWIRGSGKWVPIANIFMAFGTWIAVGAFVSQILGNEEAPIPVIGKSDKPTTPVTKIRLFNLNVDHGYPDFEDHRNRFAQTVAELKMKSLDADVLVLQEVWNTNKFGNIAELLSGELGMNFAYARANGSRTLIGFEEGSAILSRFPILEARRIVLRPRWPWWENRIALVVKLDLGEETLTVVGVHLSVTNYDPQAEHLIDSVQPISADIIAGDLNAKPDTKAVAAFQSRGFVEVIPKKAARRAISLELSNESAPNAGIDHVFLSHDFQRRWRTEDSTWIMMSRYVHCDMPLSDHDGILVDLQRR